MAQVTREPSDAEFQRPPIASGEAGRLRGRLGFELTVSSVAMGEPPSSRPAPVDVGMLLTEEVGSQLPPELLCALAGEGVTLQAETEGLVAVEMSFRAEGWNEGSWDFFSGRESGVGPDPDAVARPWLSAGQRRCQVDNDCGEVLGDDSRPPRQGLKQVLGIAVQGSPCERLSTTGSAMSPAAFAAGGEDMTTESKVRFVAILPMANKSRVS